MTMGLIILIRHPQTPEPSSGNNGRQLDYTVFRAVGRVYCDS